MRYKNLLLLILLISFQHSYAIARIAPVSNAASLNPVGSGARALGMGGAFIGVADDATAASWNPAGLIQLQRAEISGVGSFFLRQDDYSFSDNSPNNTFESISFAENISREKSRLNFASIVYPTKSAVFSLSLQHLYSFKKDLDFRYTESAAISPGMPGNVTSNGDIEIQQKGSIFALSPSVAFKLIDNVAVGFTLNIYRDRLLWNNGWSRRTRTKENISFPGSGNALVFQSESLDKFEDMKGVNFNIGLLWEITRKLNLGVVFKSPFTASFQRTRKIQSSTSTGTSTKSKVHISFPMSYGFGMAYRVTDALTLALDVYRTEWSQYTIEDGGTERSPVTGEKKGNSKIRATHQIRLGGEYLIENPNYVIPIRLGGFYDPEPSNRNPDNYWGVSAGTGFDLLGKFSLDFAYQLRWGKNVEEALAGIPSTEYNSYQHKVLISGIFYF